MFFTADPLQKLAGSSVLTEGVYSFKYIFNYVSKGKPLDFTEHCENDTDKSFVIIKDNVIYMDSCKTGMCK